METKNLRRRKQLDQLRFATEIEKSRRLDELFPNKGKIIETVGMFNDPATGEEHKAHFFSVEGAKEGVFVLEEDMSDEMIEKACTELMISQGTIQQ